MELNKAKQQLKETDASISAQKAEIDKLNHIINEADEERVRQKKEYDIVINERDILGAQCLITARRVCGPSLRTCGHSAGHVYTAWPVLTTNTFGRARPRSMESTT